MSQSINRQTAAWYAMRSVHMSAHKLSEILPEPLKECFVSPGVTNLLFIHASAEAIDHFMRFSVQGPHLGWMRDTRSHEPIVVRDRDMELFIQITSACEMPVVITERPVIKLGAHVRVIDGPFKGVEGHVVRIRKSRRILVNISDAIWAATEFVSPDLLEVLPE